MTATTADAVYKCWTNVVNIPTQTFHAELTNTCVFADLSSMNEQNFKCILSLEVWNFKFR
jgi:hypothetical protein